MKPVVLISTGDDILSGFLDYILRTDNCDVRLARDHEEALRLAVDDLPRLALLDCRSEHRMAVRLCARLRLNAGTAPVAVVALTGSHPETAECLMAAGADECIAGPVAPGQLITRMRALLGDRDSADLRRLQHADIEMDMATYRVHRDGRPVKLGPTEFRLLRILLERPGKVFSRDELVARAWPKKVHLGSRTVDVHVGRLRKALNTPSAADPIRTVRSVGYTLTDDSGDA